MKILSVQPQKNYILKIETASGIFGEFNVKPYLNLEAFETLRDPVEFEKVTSKGYYIEWACSADLSADTIEAHLNK